MRALRRTVIVLVVLGLLFVAADRVGAWLGGQAVASRIETELDAYDVQATPDADIRGFPFLTQVASGEYEEIFVRAGDLDVEGLTLHDTELTVSSVQASLSALIDRSGSVRAGHLDGTGVVGYDSVAAQADVDGIEGLKLSQGSDGLVNASGTVNVLGRSVDVSGIAAIEVADGAIRLNVEEVDAADVPDRARPLVEDLVSSASFNLEVPPLPYGLEVVAATPAAEGIAVEIAADDVPLTEG